MEKDQIIKGIEELKKSAPKRNFDQSVDLFINLKDLDIKQTPQEFFIQLPFQPRKAKVCALIGQELAEQAQKLCDKAVKEAEFEQYKNDKKAVKKLAEQYDFFIAQANIMPKVALAFGRILGARGKMPNPKVGAVVPPTMNIEPLVRKLQSTVKLSAKKAPVLQALVGKESMPHEQLAENIAVIYNTVIKALPNEKQNIKNVAVKLTMSKPIKL